MNTASRLVAGTLGAAALAVSGTGLASAAPTPTDPQGTGGHLSPEPGGTATYVLPGVAAPLPDPTLGVPDVLRVVVTPLALLADVSGESGSQAGPTGAQAGPGSADG
ncbi:hypothetical protein [Actinomycetospora soli]|uniref:hypothetical protein n=1 Tax=Actinomycetospora soli TaxID=2893887 RepID=UPI001E570664|nr:hypothetical protein [Actinomycetospora soli]MCD2186767.1 hypothetical protein [Actinomycetospora soli]